MSFQVWAARRGAIDRRTGLIFGAAACLAAWALAEIVIRPEVRAAYAVAFAPGGDRVAALSVTLGKSDGLLQIWDVPTGRSVVSRVTGDRPLSLAFGPDGASLAVGEWGGTVTLYDVRDGKTLRTFAGLTTPVRGLGFTPDGRSIAGGSSEGLVILWDVESGRERMRFDRGRFLPVNSLTISRDGRLLAASGGLRAGSTSLWDLETGLPVRRKTLVNAWEPLAFASGHSILARNGWPGGSVQLIDLDQDRVLSTLAPSTTHTLALSADERFVASGGNDGLVTDWEMATGRLVATFEEHLCRPDEMGDNIRGLLRPLFGNGILRMQTTVWSVAFSPDGSQLASASQDGSVWLRGLPGRGPSKSPSRALLQRSDRPAWFAAVRIGLPALAAILLALSYFRRGRGTSSPSVGSRATSANSDLGANIR